MISMGSIDSKVVFFISFDKLLYANNNCYTSKYISINFEKQHFNFISIQNFLKIFTYCYTNFNVTGAVYETN